MEEEEMKDKSSVQHLCAIGHKQKYNQKLCYC